MPCNLNPQFKIMSMVSSWYVAREYHLYSIIGVWILHQEDKVPKGGGQQVHESYIKTITTMS